MSTSYEAHLVVGLDYDKLKLSPVYFDPDSNDDSEDDFEAWTKEVYDQGIEKFAPYCDADSEECFYGVKCDVDNKSPEQISAIIQIAMKKFKDVTGLNGEVRVTLDVC
jgi:hypothetical protein